MDEAFTTTITLDIEGVKGLTLLGEVIGRLEEHVIIWGVTRRLDYVSFTFQIWGVVFSFFWGG